MCSRPKKVIIPPHPTPASGLVSHRPCVQGQRTLSSHPTPPDPSLRSRVASTMCARPKNVIIPPHPTRPLAQILCGIDHVLGWWIHGKKFLNPTKKVSESNEKSFWIQWKKFLNPTKKVSESDEKSFWIQRKKFLNPTKKVSESNEKSFWIQRKSFWIQRKKFLNPTKKVSESNEKSFWIQRKKFLNPTKRVSESAQKVSEDKVSESNEKVSESNEKVSESNEKVSESKFLNPGKFLNPTLFPFRKTTFPIVSLRQLPCVNCTMTLANQHHQQPPPPTTTTTTTTITEYTVLRIHSTATCGPQSAFRSVFALHFSTIDLSLAGRRINLASSGSCLRAPTKAVVPQDPWKEDSLGKIESLESLRLASMRFEAACFVTASRLLCKRTLALERKCTLAAPSRDYTCGMV